MGWWWLWLAGCGADPDWLRTGALPPAPVGCPVPPPARAQGAVELRLVLEAGVSEARAIALGGIAASWWASQGLALRPGGIHRVATGPALGGDAVALEREVAGMTPEAADARVLEVALAPLRGWLSAEATPARPRIDVVFVDQIAPPDSPMARVAADVAGLTLAPALLADDTLGGALAARLGAIGPFTPTVVLADDVLARLPADEAAWVLPHELGHALGLPHDPEVGNLMAPGFYRCPPALRADQAGRLALPGG